MAVTGSLNEQAISGSIWSFMEKFSVLIVQFIVGIILARLLDPKDYGLVALTMIFTGVSAAITDGGFEKSLIHKQDLSRLQISTVFYINMLLGIGMMLILIAAAPSLSVFFREPKLTPVLQVVSVGILINALGQTPSALLRKEFNFKKISFAHMLGSFLGGAVGLIMAYNGYGVWALVYSTLVSQVIMLVGYLLYSTWRPQLAFSYNSIKEMLPYGLNILYSSFLFFAIQQFNNFIIGRFYNKSDLGLYHRGSRFPELITSIIEGVVLKMAFPLFAKVQNDNQQLTQMLEKIVKLLAFVCFPLLTILFVNASDVTLVLFTSKWSGSIIYLELFCFVKLFYPFIIIYKEVLLVKGHAKLSSRILTIFSAFEIILVLLLVKYGIIYMILSMLISTIIQYFIYIKIISSKINLSVWTQIKWMQKYLLISIIVGVLTYLLDKVLWSLNDILYLKLIIKVIVGAITYCLLILAFKIDEVSYLKSAYQMLLKRFVPKKSALL